MNQEEWPKRLLWLIISALVMVVMAGILTPFMNQIQATLASLSSRPTPHSVHPTSTVPTSTVSTNRNPYPPYGGTLVLNDPLRDNKEGHQWDVVPTHFGTCTFVDGVYDVVATNNNTYHRCGAQNTNFSNFAYEVEAKILRGSCAAMIFRADFLQFHYYYFHICQNQSYALWIYTQNGPQTKVLVENTSSNIRIGLGQSNLMAVVAIDDSLTLYVNHQPLHSLQDSTHSQGQIGLAVDNDMTPTEVAFRHAKVWTL